VKFPLNTGGPAGPGGPLGPGSPYEKQSRLTKSYSK